MWVTAYKNLKPTDYIEDEQGDVRDTEGNLIPYTFSPFSYDDLKDYQHGLLSEINYLFDGYDEHYMGSCKSYNDWREILARESGYADAGFDSRPHLTTAWQSTTGPHWLLLNFTDGDGTICNCRCKKILAELVEFEEKAKTLGKGFMEIYTKLREMFEFAIDGGVVHFKQ